MKKYLFLYNERDILNFNQNDMSKKDDVNINEKEILDNWFEEIQEELHQIEEIEEKMQAEIKNENEEILKLKETIARIQADNQNFKMRVERDRLDTMFFLKNDIFKKILPRIDDLERMIKDTPSENKTGTLYDWVLAIEKGLKRDLENLWVKQFISIWETVNPDKHEVMTQIPSDNPWVIVDEFEKGYMLGDRVLRVAKVIVGA